MSLQNQSTNRANSKLVSKRRPTRFLTKTPLAAAISLVLMTGSVHAATIQGIKFTDNGSVGYSQGEDIGRPNEYVFVKDLTSNKFFSAKTGTDGTFTISGIDPTHQLNMWTSIPADWEQTVPILNSSLTSAQLADFTSTGILTLNFGVRPIGTPSVTPDPCATPTIKSVGDGDWDNASLWLRSSGAAGGPGENDVILVATNVVAPNGNSSKPSIILGNSTLCIAVNATLRSAPNTLTHFIDGTSPSSELVIVGKTYLSDIQNISQTGKVFNRGKIIGADGMKGKGLEPSSSCSWGNTSNCRFYKRATAGSSIRINVETFENGLTGSVTSGNGGDDRTHEYMDGPPFGSPPKPAEPFYYSSNGTGYWGIRTEGGRGGDVEILTQLTTNNYGLIQSGYGGEGDSWDPIQDQGGSVHGTTRGGFGGSVTVAATSMDTSLNAGAIVGGCGGDADLAGMFSADSWAGKGSAESSSESPMFVALGSLEEGTVKGCDGNGTVIWWDPTTMKVSKKTKIEGSNIIIYGRKDWTIDLTKLSEGAIKADDTITLAVGTGGAVDLRGLSGKVFNAGKKFEIFTDNLLLDAGVTIQSLVNATEIVVKPAKSIRNVSLSTTRNVSAEPNAVLPITVQVRNNGTETETFSLRITDEKGWITGVIPTSVVVDPLKQTQINLSVKLPELRGENNNITVTAVSQAEQNITATTRIGLNVSLGPDKDGDTIPDVRDVFPNDITEWNDSDKDGVGDNADTDDDNDGMPDVWEIKYLSVLNSIVNDAAGDADKDGFTNLEEFKAGTDPSDANSKPVVATPKVDLWIADPSPDDGTEPGKADWIWVSPNVWVRNQADDKQGYQNPIFGQDNYVYVSIKNRGTLASTKPTKVEVYRSGASMGRGWPVGWDLVGTAVIDTLGAGKDTTVGIKWDKDKVPAPGHYCFYARVVSDEDPMFAVEGNDLVLNTRQNNNVAWRNFDVVGLLRQVTDTFQVNVGNPAAAPKTVAVVFNEQENLLKNDGAKVTVDLGAVLFQRWQQAGGQGENIKVLNGTEVQLLATPAKLIGLVLQANEQLPITMRVEAFKPAPGAGVSREYHFSAQEFEGTTLIGGVDYAIITRAQDTDSDGDGIKDVVDTDNDNDGIPDEWEAKYGLNLLDATDASGDLDKDGVSNLDEFKANTVPTDATSLPKPAVVVGEYTAYGTIKDKAGAALAGATVQVGDSKTTTTDAAGNWSISGLVEGKYDVFAIKDNFRCFKSDVEIGNEQYQQQVTCSPITSLTAKTKPHTWADIPESKEITYTNTLLNGGSQTATGIVLKATLPVGSELVSLEGLDGAVCDAKALTCSVPDLTPGATANMKLVVRAVKAGSFRNVITVTSNEYPVEVADTWSTVKPHFSVNFTSTPKPVVMEGVLHYQAAVELSAFAPEKIAKGVTLNMLLPSGTKLQDISTKNGACDEKDFPKVVCQLNDLSIEKADSISRALVDLNVKLLDTGLLVLTADAKATATNYPAHTKLEKTSVLVPPVEVDIALLQDTTFSMHQEKGGAIQGLTKLIDDQIKTGKSPRVALIEFKDNVMLRYFGSDMQLLKKIIEGLQVDGGGECPEASGEALQLALNHIKSAGTIMLITDASPHAGTNVEALLKRIEEKKVNLMYIPTGDCTSGQPSWNDVQTELKQ